ncbi:aldose 1-epimerase family protein [Sphingomonas sp. PB2P19]|uniref:aldose 1-epimerase family protein n=1 Tax=Sphingomonas rhamnosi TaxID=3096156 RepID=UPI002FC5AB3F
MTDLITIANAHLTAAINPFGAELTHLRDAAGRELMTDADPAFWTGHAPILFPVVGVVNDGVIRLDGRDYPMPKHGFARRTAFTLVDHSATTATFRLTDSDETRAAYPFAFALDIVFTLDGATLAIDAQVRNTGDVTLPASFGFHPAFAWPLPYGQDRADHRIMFESEEPDALRVIAPDGTIAREDRTSPLDGRDLFLRDDLFATDALVWDDVKSHAVIYGAPQGPHLAIAFPDTPKLGIWTKPGAAYVCVEPWHGIADPTGYTGDYRDKPGVFEVAAGDTKRIAMSVTLVP